MRRRDVLKGSGAIAILAAMPRRAEVRAEPRDSSAAQSLYSAIFERALDLSPELATRLARDGGSRATLRGRLGDMSFSGRLGPSRALVEALPQLQGLSRTRMTLEQVVWLETLTAHAARVRELGTYEFGGLEAEGYPVPFAVSQMNGSYLSVPAFLTGAHRITTTADAQSYLQRLQAFGRVLDQETARLREDARSGIVPPAKVIAKSLLQLRAQAGTGTDYARLIQHLAQQSRSSNLGGKWEDEGQQILSADVQPAIARQAAQLEELIRRAGPPNLSGVRGGRDYFESCLRFHTTTNLDAEAIHAIGISQTMEIEAELDPLLRKQGLVRGTVGARLAQFARESRQLYANDNKGRRELLADLRAEVASMRALMPKVFSRVPNDEIRIDRISPEVELGASRAFSVRPSRIGPGAFYINLADTGIWPRWGLPTLAYHESLPGHLFQFSNAMGNPAVPVIDQIVTAGAFVEGWGLYAEQLAAEIGAYDRFPEGRIGMLQSLLHRTVRLSAETGLHARGWSRQRAISHLADTVGIKPALAESEVDRYSVWPGQGTTYKIGHNQFVRLRERARARLGTRFNLRDFHETALGSGNVSLMSLERLIDDWAQRAAG